MILLHRSLQEDGEVGVGGNDDQANADLWAPLAREEVAGGGRSTASGGSGGSEYGGGVVPVGFGRGKAVEQLHGLTAELARGLARAEKLRRRGSTARVSSPAFCGAAAAFRGVWAGKEREGEGNGMKSLPWSRGVRKMGAQGAAAGPPRRRRGGGRGRVAGRVAREGEGQRDAKERWRGFGVTRGQLCKQEVAEGGPRRQAGGERKD